jgi:sugar/nucleoside kinase (ribokinase family)
MNHLLVIGEASFDRVHLPEAISKSVGGAGVYTAMAAHRCGAHVALFGLRPEPCPKTLQPVADRLNEWLGPAVSPEQLPRFEIAYRGDKTEYLAASRGAEPTLSPAMLPADLSTYDLVHVTAKASLEQQLAFVEACRQRGAPQISAGADLSQTLERPAAVRAIVEKTDYFFLNEVEAGVVFGSLEAVQASPGQVFYVTRGARGALVVQGGMVTAVAAVPAKVVDATGAGDTFCGATLAYLLQKQQPIMAARRAVALAAEKTSQPGPAALLSAEPAPEALLDARVRVDEAQVRRIARRVAVVAAESPFPFVGPTFPPAGHPQAADYFFAATLQQFGFWTARGNRYDQPLIAPIGGTRRKGSDYLFAAITRRLEVDAGFCSPARQAELSQEELLDVFRSDDGRDPMPALDLHLEQARQYGRDMLALGLTPQTALDQAQASARPLETFLLTLDHVGGYKEDPLRKKSLLLAMILKDRPEQFLPLADDALQTPIMDYHFIRSCLRIGLIEVVEEALKAKLVERRIVSVEEEWAVRYPAYLALDQLIALSGRGLSVVNAYLFTNARTLCPEMSEPQCHSCQLETDCAQRKSFFQPVLRTAFY